jgi:hypothetical protein
MENKFIEVLDFIKYLLKFEFLDKINVRKFAYIKTYAYLCNVIKKQT